MVQRWCSCVTDDRSLCMFGTFKGGFEAILDASFDGHVCKPITEQQHMEPRLLHVSGQDTDPNKNQTYSNIFIFHDIRVCWLKIKEVTSHHKNSVYISMAQPRSPSLLTLDSKTAINNHGNLHEEEPNTQVKPQPYR